jgi:hypothetical protein
MCWIFPAWVVCSLSSSLYPSFTDSEAVGYARPAMELNFVEFPTAISLQDPPLPRFKEVPLLRHLLRPGVASMTVLTAAQVASVSMVAVLEYFTSWQTMVSLAKKCLSGHV